MYGILEIGFAGEGIAKSAARVGRRLPVLSECSVLHGGAFQGSFLVYDHLHTFTFKSVWPRGYRLLNHLYQLFNSSLPSYTSLRTITSATILSLSSKISTSPSRLHIFHPSSLAFKQSTCARFSTSSTTSAGAGSRSLTDRMDKCFASADKPKRNVLASPVPNHNVIMTLLPEARALAISACGSRFCIERLEQQEERPVEISDITRHPSRPHLSSASTNATALRLNQSPTLLKSPIIQPQSHLSHSRQCNRNDERCCISTEIELKL